jgi:hypothetical protein
MPESRLAKTRAAYQEPSCCTACGSEDPAIAAAHDAFKTPAWLIADFTATMRAQKARLDAVKLAPVSPWLPDYVEHTNDEGESFFDRR